MTQNVTEAARECRSCRHFRNDAAYLEEQLKGFASLGSGDASTRGEDGLCTRHDRYIGARASCSAYTLRPSTGSRLR
jgi:hypothetical protein